MERGQSTETRDSEDLQTLREANLSRARDNLLQSVVTDRPILNFGAAELETARIQSLLEDAQHGMNSWSRAEGPTGVGPRDTSLLMATHTTGNISQSAVQNLSVASS